MNSFKKTEPAKIAGRLAYYMGEINAIHPFREEMGVHKEFLSLN